MTHLCAGIAQLNDSGYSFTLRESLEAFVNHLPDMDHKPTKDLMYQSLNSSDHDLPTFKSILECVLTTDTHINHTHPPAVHSRLHPTSTTTTSTLSTTVLMAATPSNPNVITSTTSHPPRSANYCSNCQHTGHMIENCWHPGGGQKSPVDHTKMAQAHVANVEIDDNPDGGGTIETPETDEDTTSIPFAAFVTTPTAAVNNDIYLDWYDIGVTSTYAFSSLFKLLPFESPVSCAFIAGSFNMILNSGCTNHIIRDRALFWTYREDQAVPVKMANCGILNMLAHGDVKFSVPFGDQRIILILCNCLHAPNAPLNLLSVGAMQEKHMCIHFNEDHMVIHFPSNHPVSSGHTINAVVFCHLSFLQCEFLQAELPVSDGSEFTFPTFTKVELTTELWHHRLGHIGVNAMCGVLTKNYVEGIDWTGSF